MTETKQTLIFVAAAAVLAVIAFLMSPSRVTPEAFLDQGEPFFPDFTDPNKATTLEVIDYDEETGSAKPFKVTFKNGQWTIPSHHDYPADAENRLAKTAAGVIGIKKDDFRTNNVGDHEACGVIDPLDESAVGLAGRGKRVTLKDQSGAVLADFIVGKKVLNRPGMRFVRVPGQNRVYASKIDVDLSANFADWINPDLLQVSRQAIERIEVRDYSINERSLKVDQRDNLVVYKNGDTWKADHGSTVDSSKIKDLLAALDQLSIVGVRPKPEGISAGLKSQTERASISQAEQMSLQNKGYYLSSDGQLLSNEGEMIVTTNQGVRYTLRFGEVLYGSGLEVTAGSDAGDEDQGKGQENRYLFVTTEFEPAVFGSKPPAPTNNDYRDKADSLWNGADSTNAERKRKLDDWNRRYDKGQEIVKDLNSHFADWYYVISGDAFDKLDVGRSDLIAAKS
jgi:hypothetical protein